MVNNLIFCKDNMFNERNLKLLNKNDHFILKVEILGMHKHLIVYYDIQKMIMALHLSQNDLEDFLRNHWMKKIDNRSYFNI